MSTNYYFKVEPRIWVTGGSRDVIDEMHRITVLDLHIGKRSAGWKPLFHKTKFYASVQEIKDFYSENWEITIIENEFGDILSMEELEDELFDWESERNKSSHLRHIAHYKDEEGYEFSETEFS